jgi:hypothetical protein
MNRRRTHKQAKRSKQTIHYFYFDVNGDGSPVDNSDGTCIPAPIYIDSTMLGAPIGSAVTIYRVYNFQIIFRGFFFSVLCVSTKNAV